MSLLQLTCDKKLQSSTRVLLFHHVFLNEKEQKQVAKIFYESKNREFEKILEDKIGLSTCQIYRRKFKRQEKLRRIQRSLILESEKRFLEEKADLSFDSESTDRRDSFPDIQFQNAHSLGFCKSSFFKDRQGLKVSMEVFDLKKKAQKNKNKLTVQTFPELAKEKSQLTQINLIELKIAQIEKVN